MLLLLFLKQLIKLFDHLSNSLAEHVIYFLRYYFKERYASN